VRSGTPGTSQNDEYSRTPGSMCGRLDHPLGAVVGQTASSTAWLSVD
jgi:hypothetical protein